MTIDRNKIKAIPTKYNGVTFRSKMESLFARWCDDNKQKWIYEPEGLTNGKECYLPDFYLPNSKIIVEIKPVFFLSETHKLDIILNCEKFDKFGLAVLEVGTNSIKILRYSSSWRSGRNKRWDRNRSSESYARSGFCGRCHSFQICSDESDSECTNCGYYDETGDTNDISGFFTIEPLFKGKEVVWIHKCQ